MARQIDNYKNFPTRNIQRTKRDAPEVWAIAKPEPEPLLNRLIDAWKVATGEYDAVYYQKDIV